ncbi:hypothetical protein SAMN05444354_10899 [Stigmatella aurantiaca]|uniref:DUF3152 domain-containing protein n=1 Tax=Stigmatella aurantiaca TaxID=41 RepID=A0A1H7ST58_STIAU|nr:hypothetical protein [Stigmatella aurantiaca]SEL75114.1 hypothetical protein SAMN05444354_10899 [Stigmatella aurantiaca]
MNSPSHAESLSRRRLPRWIALGWVSVLSFVAWRHVPLAQASHSHNGSYQVHISTIHGNDGTSTTPGPQDEQYCILPLTAAVNATQIANLIEETLAKMGAGQMWDGTGAWRVDLWRAAKFCNQYDSATRATIGIEYQIADSWASVCGGDLYSCVVQSNPVVDPVNGHTHFKWMYSHLKAQHLSTDVTRARKFINHETGHVLGLKDPSGPNDCSHSVMHNDLYSNYGCLDKVWYPTPNDVASVTKIQDRRN